MRESLFKSKQENQKELRASLSQLSSKALAEEVAWAKRHAAALHDWALQVYLEFASVKRTETKEE